jgi:hypothetical protein
VTGPSEPSGSGFDRLAVAFSTGLSRRQVAKLGAGLAFSAMVPGVARAARWPGARAADKTRGSCPPQARKECSSGALRGDWVHGCAESAAKGVASTFNGCGPEAGIPVSLFDHEFARGDYIPDNPFYLGHFFSACQGHDCCYGQCGGNKAQCDSDFLAKMRAACDTRWPLKTIADSIIYGQMAALCYAVADAYYDAVSTTTTGQDAYDAGQKAVCDCCIDCPTQAKLLGYLDYNHWAVCPDPDAATGFSCTSLCASEANCGACGKTCPPQCDESGCQEGVCQNGGCVYQPGALDYCNDCQGHEDCMAPAPAS